MQTEAFQAFVKQDAYTAPTRFGPGAVTVAGIGYGFGNGVRLELEADYRHNAERSGMVRAGVAVRGCHGHGASG